MSISAVRSREEADVCSEDVEIKGHIIDSLMLPKILDGILSNGGTFRIKQINIGQSRHDPSYAVVEVRSGDKGTLSRILAQIADHGAVPTVTRDCRPVAADIAGAFPEEFYSTTNQRTEVRLGGQWVPVEDQEMDCGILVDTAARTARCVPMNEVRVGDTIVVGHSGVRAYQEIGAMLGCRVIPLELVLPHFYHLDTCFCPLEPAAAAYYPPAFDEYGQRVLRELIADLIPVDDAESQRFACNAVVVGRTVITNTGCPQLHRQLRARGFEPWETPLGEFVKAGGSAKCLTLRLDGEEAAAWKHVEPALSATAR